MYWLYWCQITHIFVCLYLVPWNYSFWYIFSNLLTKLIMLLYGWRYNLDSRGILSFIYIFKQIFWWIVVLHYLKIDVAFIFFKCIFIIWHNIFICYVFIKLKNTSCLSSSVHNFIILFKICLVTECFWVTFFTFTIYQAIWFSGIFPARSVHLHCNYIII